MSVFSDFLDLRTAVIEQIGNADIADVFPRLVKMAEADFNRRLRCREQITELSITVADGIAPVPDDMAEPIGLFTTSGRELAQTARSGYERLGSKDGFWSMDGSNIMAQDADYAVIYYAKVPTITGSMTDSNWLLQKHPELYLYAVSEKAAKHMSNVELATAAGSLAETEYSNVAGQDHNERFARARVRVVGVTP